MRRIKTLLNENKTIRVFGSLWFPLPLLSTPSLRPQRSSAWLTSDLYSRSYLKNYSAHILPSVFDVSKLDLVKTAKSFGFNMPPRVDVKEPVEKEEKWKMTYGPTKPGIKGVKKRKVTVWRVRYLFVVYMVLIVWNNGGCWYVSPASELISTKRKGAMTWVMQQFFLPSATLSFLFSPVHYSSCPYWDLEDWIIILRMPGGFISTWPDIPWWIQDWCFGLI